jgi:hypothetical protein
MLRDEKDYKLGQIPEWEIIEHPEPDYREKFKIGSPFGILEVLAKAGKNTSFSYDIWTSTGSPFIEFYTKSKLSLLDLEAKIKDIIKRMANEE